MTDDAGKLAAFLAAVAASPTVDELLTGTGPIQAVCVHDGGVEHPSDGTFPCGLKVRPCPDYAAGWRGEHPAHEWDWRANQNALCPGRSYTREQRWDQALDGWTVFLDTDGVHSIRAATDDETRAQCMALADHETSIVTAQRDDARATAVALEQQLGRVAELADELFVADCRYYEQQRQAGFPDGSSYVAERSDGAQDAVDAIRSSLAAALDGEPDA